MHSLRHYINLIESANITLESKIFWTRKKIDDLKRLTDQKNSILDIAKYFGVSKVAIKTALTKFYPERSHKRQKTNWTDQMIADLKRLSDQQIIIPDIAKYFGVSKATIDNALQRYYPERSHRQQQIRWTDQMIADLKRLHDQLTSTPDIAKYFGVPTSVIDTGLKRYYPDRNPAEIVGEANA